MITHLMLLKRQCNNLKKLRTWILTHFLKVSNLFVSETTEICSILLLENLRILTEILEGHMMNGAEQDLKDKSSYTLLLERLKRHFIRDFIFLFTSLRIVSEKTEQKQPLKSVD